MSKLGFRIALAMSCITLSSRAPEMPSPSGVTIRIIANGDAIHNSTVVGR